MTIRQNNVIIYAMDIILTDHAKTRILQRKITEEEIKSVIDAPEAIKESFKERAVIRKKVSKEA